jgi:hypothetical protein
LIGSVGAGPNINTNFFSHQYRVLGNNLSEWASRFPAGLKLAPAIVMENLWMCDNLGFSLGQLVGIVEIQIGNINKFQFDGSGTASYHNVLAC